MNEPLVHILFPPEALFPLDRGIFDAFLNLPQYSLGGRQKNGEEETRVTDGELLFRLVSGKLWEAGVRFSSPGNSSVRHFILWFNAHFSNAIPYSRVIELKQSYFGLIYSMVVQLLVQTPRIAEARLHFHSSVPESEIEDERLTPLGKTLIRDLLLEGNRP